MAIQTRKQAIWAGHTFFTLLNDDGTPKSEPIGIMCAEVFQYTPTFNRIDVTSGCIEDYGQNIETFNIPQPATTTVTLKEVTAPVLAMLFMGESQDASLAAINDVTQTFVVPNDGWNRIASTYENMDSFVVAGSVEPTDYVFHLASGYFRIAAGGNINVGDTITYDAVRAAKTIQEIIPLSQTSILVRIEWYGQNIKTGEKYSHVIGRANLVPNANIDWQSTEPQTVSLTGTAETVTGGITSRVTVG